MPRRSRAKIRLALHNSAYTEHVPATITSWQLELFVIGGCARSQQGIQSIIPLSALSQLIMQKCRHQLDFQVAISASGMHTMAINNVQYVSWLTI